MNKIEHRYATGSSGDWLNCACGHQEPIDDGIGAAVERMNAHIRASFTDKEWEAKMQNTRLATLDLNTGHLDMSKGPKS